MLVVIDINQTTPIWATAPDVVNPLFDAYDIRIAELEDIIAKQAAQADAIRESVQSLVTENNQLRQSQLDNLRLLGSSSSMINNDVPLVGGNIKMTLQSELVADLNQRIEMLISENTLLNEQKIVITNELDNYQSELSKKSNELASAVQQIISLTKEKDLLNNRKNQLEFERDEAANQAVAYSDALGKADGELDLSKIRVQQLEKSVHDMEIMVNDTIRELKLVKDKADADCLSYVRRAKQAEDRVRELHILLLTKTKELDSSQEVARKLKRQYQSTCQDAEGMLQVMSGFERQIAEYATREEAVKRILKENTEKMEEVVIEKERIIASERNAQKQIDVLNLEIQKLTSTLASEVEYATQRILSNIDEKVKSYERDIQDLNQRAVDTKIECEQATRDGKAAKIRYEKLYNNFIEERNAKDELVKELEDKLRSNIVLRQEATSHLYDMQELNKELRSTIDKLRYENDDHKNRSLLDKKNYDNELAVLKSNIREVSRDAYDWQRKYHNKSKEMAEYQSSIEHQQTNYEKKFLEEVEIYRRKMHDAERSLKEIEEKNIDSINKTQSVIDSIKEKSALMYSHLETKASNEYMLKNDIINRNNELAATVSELVNDKTVLVKVIEEAKKTIQNLRDEINDNKATISALTQQLSLSFQERDTVTSNALKTITEMNTIKHLTQQSESTRVAYPLLAHDETKSIESDSKYDEDVFFDDPQADEDDINSEITGDDDNDNDDAEF